MESLLGFPDLLVVDTETAFWLVSGTTVQRKDITAIGFYDIFWRPCSHDIREDTIIRGCQTSRPRSSDRKGGSGCIGTVRIRVIRNRGAAMAGSERAVRGRTLGSHQLRIRRQELIFSI